MELKELSKTKAKEYRSLANKKTRDEMKLFIAEGEKCISDLLPEFEPESLIFIKSKEDYYTSLLKNYSSNLMVSDHRGLEIISSQSTAPEVIGIFKIPAEENEIYLLSDNKLYLLLDDIQDPGNLGTIVRTCDWFGVYDIYASQNTADVFSPKVVKSTMGSLARVKVHYVDLNRLLELNKEKQIMGAMLSGESIYKCSLPKDGLLIMGNEGHGISQGLIAKINRPLTIPPVNKHQHPDSLNVAIATAIILSEILS